MLDLAKDCLRFVTGYYEVISASSPHIYHSALVLAPKESIVWGLYGSQADPFTRVVHGGLISWDTHIAAAMCHSAIDLAVWSPCDRFIAVTYKDTVMVDILDSVTLQHLVTLKYSNDAPRTLKALAFSPDSHSLMCSSSSSQELFVISWDLQTGGVASVIRQPTPDLSHIRRYSSITYSTNGRIAGVFYQYSNPGGADWTISISIFDVASNACTHSHLLEGCALLSNNTWTQGESLRFITINEEAINIWETGFTSSTPPTRVDTLPVPDILNSMDYQESVIKFSPTSSRFALIFHDGVLVWDFLNSKYLLHFMKTGFNPVMFFSSDGRSLGCSTTESKIYLWKDSPDGFILHGTLTASAEHVRPLLSQDSESIVTYGGRTIQLWHGIETIPTTPPSVPTQAPHCTGDIILDLSPDSMLAAVAIQKENVVRVLDLNSGVLQSTIDVGMEVYGLGVMKNTTVVIGSWNVSAWHLPIGDGTLGAKAGPKDYSWTMALGGHRLGTDVISASVSPDSHYIALTVLDHDFKDLHVYHTSTGERLAWSMTEGSIPRFSLNGLYLWCVQDSGKAEVREVSAWIEEYKSPMIDVSKRADVDYIERLPEGCPWGSSRGYQVTDGWWILGPDGKRLLMLPPPWRSEPLRRVWKEQFLALLHHEIPEPVILELL